MDVHLVLVAGVRQVDVEFQALEQAAEARGVADRIEEEIDVDSGQSRIAHLDRALELGERAIAIVEAGIHLSQSFRAKVEQIRGSFVSSRP